MRHCEQYAAHNCKQGYLAAYQNVNYLTPKALTDIAVDRIAPREVTRLTEYTAFLVYQVLRCMNKPGELETRYENCYEKHV